MATAFELGLVPPQQSYDQELNDALSRLEARSGSMRPVETEESLRAELLDPVQSKWNVLGQTQLTPDQFNLFQRDFNDALATLEARQKDIRPYMGETLQSLRQEILGPVEERWSILLGRRRQEPQTQQLTAAERNAAQATQHLTEAQRLRETGNERGAMLQEAIAGVYGGRFPREEREQTISLPIPLQEQPRSVALGMSSPQTVNFPVSISDPLVQRMLGTNMPALPQPAIPQASAVPQTSPVFYAGPLEGEPRLPDRSKASSSREGLPPIEDARREAKDLIKQGRNAAAIRARFKEIYGEEI